MDSSTCVERGHQGGEADRGHHAGEGEGLGQGQDGEVVGEVVISVIVGVVRDGGDGADVRLGVGGVVLAHLFRVIMIMKMIILMIMIITMIMIMTMNNNHHQDADGRCCVARSAVGGRQNMAGGDDGASAPGPAAKAGHEPHLQILVLHSIFMSHALIFLL